MADNEFDLRELLGDDSEAEGRMPTIEDVPASQLNVHEVDVDVKCAFCDCFMVAMRAHKKVCRFHESHDFKDECLTCKVKKQMASPDYVEKWTRTEPVHPTPPANLVVVDDPVGSKLSDNLKDADIDDVDADYYQTFNATIQQVANMEAEDLQKLRHRLHRMIHRAKIQIRGIQVTEEGKVKLIEEKRRAAIRAKDTEFMSKRKKASEEAASQAGSPKAKSTSKTAAVPAVEKQIKQFVKLNMNEATIRATLTGLGTSVPANLSELIAKYSK